MNERERALEGKMNSTSFWGLQIERAYLVRAGELLAAQTTQKAQLRDKTTLQLFALLLATFLLPAIISCLCWSFSI